MKNKRKRIISIIIIIIALPLSVAFAATGGGILGYFFAILLAVGVNMLLDN